MAASEISVTVPVYNGAAFYDSALDSILRQDCPHLEIIVVDDGSTDDLDENIRRRRGGVRCFLQPRRGPAAARNTGIRAASARCPCCIGAMPRT